MKLIDEILNEWSFRCDDGIVDLNNPKKKKILKAILKEYNLTEEEIEEQIESKYDDVLNKEFNDEIPKVFGKYVLGVTTKVNSKDLKNYKQLFPVTPPKVGKEIESAGSKGSGNGEIAVYWLFRYQSNPSNATDTRGKGAPDLNIDGKGIEIKSYDSPKMTLGRVGSDHENVQLLNTIFGLHSLVSNINRDEKIEKQHSSLNFTKKGIIQAFTSFIDFKNNDELKDLATKYPLIKNIYDKINDVANILGEDFSTAEDAAAAMIKRLLIKKSAEKPGFGGYILNVHEGGDLKWNQITEEKINNLTTDKILDNIFLNQGMLVMNSDKLFD